MKTIGLTGGIGSGKSTVAEILAELGAHVIDADRVGHEVYQPGTAGFRQVVDAFGRAIVAADGTIDRKRLGSIVFSDQARLLDLNRIVHPLIRAAIRERVATFRRSDRTTPLVIEAALLIEASWATLTDEVWVVTAERAVVVARVQAQRALAPDEIEARMRTQIGDEERCRRADVVIDNSGTVEQLRERLASLWKARLGAPSNAS